MEEFLLEQKQKICKYCGLLLVPCLDEGLECTQCQNYVHLKCLKRGSVPGGLEGDVFYIYTCLECSDRDTEKFVRQKISWLQALVLALYHLQTKSGGLGNNGFFHWRHHIVSFVDRHSDIIFPNEKQRKKKWVGTIAGRLSHYSGYLFVSGSKTIFNKPAWWTLMYPKITPGVLSEVYNALNLEKQRVKLNNEKKVLTDAQMFYNILTQYITDPNLTQTIDVTNDSSIQFENIGAVELEIEKKKAEMKVKGMKRKQTTQFMVPQNKKLIKLAPKSIAPSLTEPVLDRPVQIQSQGPSKIVPTEHKKSIRLIDPMCYYNTSLSNISRMKMLKMTVKLTGNTRKEMILSPYSGIYLKPYIRRDTETFPNWLKLMAELQLEANKNNAQFVLPPRAPIDYSYVQPEHIPAINSLCNQFFWPGIDLTDSLQYPDFSCVALYKKLIIGFAFLVPDVKHTENYISFVFTRPAWRNCGIAKFMMYHLIQTSLGRDVTLHVSIDNPALFLYQKFGFKVENVVLDFYDKYYRSDVRESKNAFFCRLER